MFHTCMIASYKERKGIHLNGFSFHDFTPPPLPPLYTISIPSKEIFYYCRFVVVVVCCIFFSEYEINNNNNKMCEFMNTFFFLNVL